MTPEDRKAARDALESGRLTIQEVTALREECERTGRSFVDLVSERHPGKLPPSPRERPGAYLLLLIASGVVILGLFATTLVGMISDYLEGDEQALTSMKSMNRTVELERETRQDYERKQVREREAKAADSLRKGREAMRAAEKGGGNAGDPAVYLKLVEARVGFDAYLETHPGDAAVLVERGRTWELLGNPKRELADLERALKGDPSLDAKVGDRIATLRVLLSK